MRVGKLMQKGALAAPADSGHDERMASNIRQGAERGAR